MEVWKNIPNYEGLYQVSDFGNVKSLERKEWCKRNSSYSIRKEKILKITIDKYNYGKVNLYKFGNKKTMKPHQLVAMAFLGHKANKFCLVINHKNFNRQDNRLENLEIITQRENANQKHLKSTSIYTGVCWHKKSKKWNAQITILNKTKNLGYFNSEIDAHNAYQKKLIEIIKTN